MKIEPRAFPEPSKFLCDKSLRDPQHKQRSSELNPPHPRAVVDPHLCRAGVLVAYDDDDETVNKEADAQLECEASHERAKKVDRTANEVWQANEELLERLRNLKL